MLKGFTPFLLKVSDDISEVRNNLPAVADYLNDEQVKSDVIDRLFSFFKKVESPEAKGETIEIEQNIFSSEVQELVVPEEKEQKGLDKMLKWMIIMCFDVFKPILVKAITARPYKVNYFQLLIVELIYQLSDNHDIHGIRYKRGIHIKNLVIDFLRRIQSDWHYFLESSLQVSDLNLEAKEFIEGQNIKLEDKMFPYYFAIALSQTSAYEINEFLSFQKGWYGEGFIDFIEDVLLINEDILNQAQIKIVRRWLEKNNPISPTASSSSNKTISDDQNQLYEDWYPIHGNLDTIQINRFFDFLSDMKNSERKPFLSAKEVSVLKKIGLKYKKDNWQPTFALDIKPKERFKIYSCFYSLWEKHSPVKNAGKEEYALYLKSHFTNFNLKTKSVQDALEKEQVSKVGFDINGYFKPL
jgi:hypothetical protein